ncbi:CoA-binding protein [Salibacterium qingdaonense]|uniref:Predicted CoA-binding protein n=1 Tax=Salibacterium qingdaonense TaxID=266892 RepID=A0A1I4K5G6_9BACI|nr:CoA-binding protein [Salibacterium qingdaonense]SFL73984.1 Predicted CoA-binding protein [Salibacterium qingdaonense]
MVTFQNPSEDRTAAILNKSTTIAVVGLSDKPSRTSWQVSKAAQEAGYRIIPVNPNAREVLGEKAAARLGDIEEHVDIVNVFRRREHLPEVAAEAAAMPDVPDVFWTQLELVSEEAARTAEQAGMMVIMDKCIKVELARLS